MRKEIFTTVTIDGVEYRIEKFGVIPGFQIARLMLAKGVPVLSLLEKMDERDDNGVVIEAVGALLNALSDDDIAALVTKCLSVCTAVLPAGDQPVMDINGHFGVADVEHNLPLALRLCIHAIKWGASAFFGENGLSLKNKPDTSQQSQ